MDHKGSISLLISSLGINRLFHRIGNSYPTTKTPQRVIQQLHMIPLRNWTEIQGGISQGNIFYFPVSPSQKPQSSHRCNKYFLSRMEQIAHSSSQVPQSYHTWTVTQPIHKPLTQSSFPLCWSLQKKHDIRPLDLFLTHDIAKIQLSRCFRSCSPNEVLFLTNYHSQILHTLWIFRTSNHLTFSSSPKKPLEYLLNLLQIYSS